MLLTGVLILPTWGRQRSVLVFSTTRCTQKDFVKHPDFGTHLRRSNYFETSSKNSLWCLVDWNGEEGYAGLQQVLRYTYSSAMIEKPGRYAGCVFEPCRLGGLHVDYAPRTFHLMCRSLVAFAQQFGAYHERLLSITDARRRVVIKYAIQ